MRDTQCQRIISVMKHVELCSQRWLQNRSFHHGPLKMAQLVKIPFIVFRLARLVFTGQASHLDTIVVLFKRPRSRQNVFTSRWPLAQKNDQRVNYKPCEYEIQASSLLSVLACWKCTILDKFHRPSWLIEPYFELSQISQKCELAGTLKVYFWK